VACVSVECHAQRSDIGWHVNIERHRMPRTPCSKRGAIENTTRQFGDA
tara:strand:- start:2684 stop:2827 length:144 start_codon:yes stop_codon:yes gene_type:complete